MSTVAVNLNKISLCLSFPKKGSKPYDDVHSLTKSIEPTLVQTIFSNWIRRKLLPLWQTGLRRFVCRSSATFPQFFNDCN